jgi:hypothetical protein
LTTRRRIRRRQYTSRNFGLLLPEPASDLLPALSKVSKERWNPHFLPPRLTGEENKLLFAAFMYSSGGPPHEVIGRSHFAAS